MRWRSHRRRASGCRLQDGIDEGGGGGGDGSRCLVGCCFVGGGGGGCFLLGRASRRKGSQKMGISSVGWPQRCPREILRMDCQYRSTTELYLSILFLIWCAYWLPTQPFPPTPSRLRKLSNLRAATRAWRICWAHQWWYFLLSYFIRRCHCLIKFSGPFT